MPSYLLKTLFCLALAMFSQATRALADDDAHAIVSGKLVNWIKIGREWDGLERDAAARDRSISNAFVYLRPLNTICDVGGDDIPSRTVGVASINNQFISPPAIALWPSGQLDVVNQGPDDEFITFDRGNYVVNVGKPLRLENLQACRWMPFRVEYGTLSNKCEVFVHENRFIAITDKDGAFTISDVPPGTWEMRICLRGLGMADQIDLSRSKSMTIDEDGLQVVLKSGKTDLERINLYVRPSRLTE